jgi:hypothetical protein
MLMERELFEYNNVSFIVKTMGCLRVKRHIGGLGYNKDPLLALNAAIERRIIKS